nr:MAG TPA: Repressor protein CI [Caudoviricetes sp.]
MYEKYVKLRDEKGVTDYRVSEDTKITKSTFSDWKSGRSNPKIDKLKLLADYFGVSIEYFLEE